MIDAPTPIQRRSDHVREALLEASADADQPISRSQQARSRLSPLASYEFAQRLLLKVRVPGSAPHVPTLKGLWPSADWLEREVWDDRRIRSGG